MCTRKLRHSGEMPYFKIPTDRRVFHNPLKTLILIASLGFIQHVQASWLWGPKDSTPSGDARIPNETQFECQIYTSIQSRQLENATVTRKDENIIVKYGGCNQVLQGLAAMVGIVVGEIIQIPLKMGMQEVEKLSFKLAYMDRLSQAATCEFIFKKSELLNKAVELKQYWRLEYDLRSVREMVTSTAKCTPEEFECFQLCKERFDKIKDIRKNSTIKRKIKTEIAEITKMIKQKQSQNDSGSKISPFYQQDCDEHDARVMMAQKVKKQRQRDPGSNKKPRRKGSNTVAYADRDIGHKEWANVAANALNA